MLTNLIRAKISTHTLTVAVAILFFAAHRFFADPQAAEWLRAHWAVRDAGETIAAVLMLLGIYNQPIKPVA
jgi:hypothetical protein